MEKFQFVNGSRCGTNPPDVMIVLLEQARQLFPQIMMGQEYLSILVQVIVAIGFAAMIVVLSALFGKRAGHRAPADVQYESGIVPIGKGNPMFSVKFYVVAMLFVVFDLEVVFLYPWAVIFKDFIVHNSEAFIAMTIFIGILLVAYLYAFGKGAFQWHKNPTPNR